MEYSLKSIKEINHRFSKMKQERLALREKVLIWNVAFSNVDPVENKFGIFFCLILGLRSPLEGLSI